MKKKLNRKIKKLFKKEMLEMQGVQWKNIVEAETKLLSLSDNQKEILLKEDYVVQQIVLRFCMLDLDGQKDITEQILEIQDLQKKSS